ncbi:MAG: hypothetical protein AB1813_11955 [Verrucomicrobiota bacterium]
MPTEADTCRTLITPKLQAAGWDSDPHSIAEQRTFTDGWIARRDELPGVCDKSPTRKRRSENSATFHNASRK